MSYSRTYWSLLAIALAAGTAACQPQIGDECQTSVDCSQSGERLCDVTQPGGYCTIFSCEPNRCPEDSECVVFGARLSAAAECVESNGLSRIQRSFCMATCSSNSDCRGGYECLDVGAEGNPWNAIVTDKKKKKACIVPFTAAPIASDQPAEVCGISGTSGAGGQSGQGGQNAGGQNAGGQNAGGQAGQGGESGETGVSGQGGEGGAQ